MDSSVTMLMLEAQGQSKNNFSIFLFFFYLQKNEGKAWCVSLNATQAPDSSLACLFTHLAVTAAKFNVVSQLLVSAVPSSGFLQTLVFLSWKIRMLYMNESLKVICDA